MRTVLSAVGGCTFRFIVSTVTGISVAGIAFPLNMIVKISGNGRKLRLLMGQSSKAKAGTCL